MSAGPLAARRATTEGWRRQFERARVSLTFLPAAGTVTRARVHARDTGCTELVPAPAQGPPSMAITLCDNKTPSGLRPLMQLAMAPREEEYCKTWCTMSCQAHWHTGLSWARVPLPCVLHFPAPTLPFPFLTLPFLFLHFFALSALARTSSALRFRSPFAPFPPCAPQALWVRHPDMVRP